MNFNQFVGQKKIKNILQRNKKENKISHAYSFEGFSGMGKLTLAKVFAKAILCENHPDDACGECISCKRFSSGNHPDFILVSTPKSSIGVDEVRNIQGQVHIKPVVSSRKVYIIEEADKMTVQAQNCLLKTLEEPPFYLTIILCVSNTNLILKTVQSRCVRLKFESYSNEEIKTILSRNFNVEKFPKINFAVAFSQGNVGRAFSVISDDFLKLRENTFRVLDVLFKGKIHDLIKVSSFFETNKNFLDEILNIMLVWYRDLLFYQKLKNENVLINSDRKNIIVNSSSNYNSIDLIQLINIIEQTRKKIKMNVNSQIAIDNMVLQMWEVYNGKSYRSAV